MTKKGAISTFLKLLKPFPQAKENISGDKKLCFYVNDYSNYEATDTHSCSMGPECQLWQNLLQELFKRFRLIEVVYLIAAGTLLDPQFKKVAFVNRSAVKQPIRRIMGKVAELHENGFKFNKAL